MTQAIWQQQVTFADQAFDTPRLMAHGIMALLFLAVAWATGWDTSIMIGLTLIWIARIAIPLVLYGKRVLATYVLTEDHLFANLPRNQQHTIAPSEIVEVEVIGETFVSINHADGGFALRGVNGPRAFVNHLLSLNPDIRVKGL